MNQLTKKSHYENKSLNYGVSHTRLKRILSLLGRKSKQRVLEVGCASGRLGREIKKLGHYVAGIEISESAAAQAKKVLDKVYVFDVESEWSADILSQKFDLVILSEILEHVFDPVYVLKKSSAVLKPAGEIILTTPNFLTWTNRFRFLFGFFKYEREGMFDFGHIRWFTYPYLKKVLAESGFTITNEKHIIFPGKLTKILKLWPSLFVRQFVVKAKKQ
ncbi:MAG: class I SAM-dependent methyltransferase [Patescibacteria group bacterium]